MRKLFFLLLLVTSTFSAAAQSGRRISAPRTTSTAPIQPPLNPEPEPLTPTVAAGDFLLLTERFREREIKALDNSTFKLADFRGKIIVVNIWASWCGPCRREVPEYEKVRKAYSAEEVEFIGLTTEDPRTASDRVNRFVRETHFGFRLGWADHEAARTLMNGKNAIPQTLVIDADGRVVKHWTGYSPGRSALRLTEVIESAFKNTP
jgi:thiol-disulfide isomerase/thioredoxin